LPPAHRAKSRSQDIYFGRQPSVTPPRSVRPIPSPPRSGSRTRASGSNQNCWPRSSIGRSPRKGKSGTHSSKDCGKTCDADPCDRFRRLMSAPRDHWIVGLNDITLALGGVRGLPESLDRPIESAVRRTCLRQKCGIPNNTTRSKSKRNESPEARTKKGAPAPLWLIAFNFFSREAPHVIPPWRKRTTGCVDRRCRLGGADEARLEHCGKCLCLRIW
jgi:hypothetical protein